jgi:hypothetical protein
VELETHHQLHQLKALLAVQRSQFLTIAVLAVAVLPQLVA